MSKLNEDEITLIMDLVSDGMNTVLASGERGRQMDLKYLETMNSFLLSLYRRDLDALRGSEADENKKEDIINNLNQDKHGGSTNHR